ncbi:MAG: Nramp family divalent metal transporter [Bacteroidales bacterium]|nr:Nramp family divalent metal transporter [Bacteroidales bacterium]
MNLSKIYKSLGPGLLYAGAAVGVSHLVQSTRAGAGYGFDLIWILLLANILKYPFFEFAPRYANSTGKSLVDGYDKIGKWALVLYAMLTITTMFAITGAVSLVTAGLLGSLLGVNISIYTLTVIILLLVMLVLILGQFAVFESIIKFIIVALALSTVAAVALAFKTPLSGNQHFDWTIATDVAFLIAFIGWMPAPLDVSVWHSTWTEEKQKNLKKKLSLKETLRDFNIGYIGTAILAIGFLSLGAFVMYGSGESFSKSGLKFSSQLINMYTNSLGSWAYWLIGIAALTTMLSTTITVLDAYPRVMMATVEKLMPKANRNKKAKKISYNFWMVITVVGTLILLLLFSRSMRFMVDMATTISFVTAPILALLNYKTVTSKIFKDKPPKWLIIYAWIGMLSLFLFTAFYLVWKFIL